MATPALQLPRITDNIALPSKITWASATSDMHTFQISPPPRRWLDDEAYNCTVLRLNSQASENDLDEAVLLEAESLGLLPLQSTPVVDHLASSLSTITVASDSNHHSSIQSIQSQSTAPTSCASSDHRPPTRSSRTEHSSSEHENLWRDLGLEKKSGSPLRRGFRKMAGFRKKRSSVVASPTLTNISSDIDTLNSEHASIKKIDKLALKRSIECEEMTQLRSQHIDERARFLEFQSSLLTQLRLERDGLKAQRREVHKRVIEEQQEKNEIAAEDLERRQLEEESKMQKEHEIEKRAVLTRIKYMEAYCQNPTPPPTPTDPKSGRPSVDSILPERKVTEKDYHYLAQQYREGEAIGALHESKLNVLRGRQEKALENLIRKKAHELQAVEKEHARELHVVDREFSGKEAELRLALEGKRARLETRWKTQALIARTKMEKSTGLKFAPLPDVIAVEGWEPTVTVV